MENLGYDIETKAGGMVKVKDTHEGPYFGTVQLGNNGLWYASFFVKVLSAATIVISSTLSVIGNKDSALLAFTTVGFTVSTLAERDTTFWCARPRIGGRRSFVEQHTGAELAPVYRADKLFFVDLSFGGPDEELTARVSLDQQQVGHCTNCDLASHVTENCWATSPELTAARAKRREKILQRGLEEEAAIQATPLFCDGLTAGQGVELYQMGVGTLEWLAKTTHPEIGYSITQCVKHCSAPTAKDTKELVSILSCCQKGWHGGHLRCGRSTTELENQAIGAVADILHRLICHLQASGVSLVEIASDHGGAIALREAPHAGPGEKADPSSSN
jgi:hypothetical protein